MYNIRLDSHRNPRWPERSQHVAFRRILIACTKLRKNLHPERLILASGRRRPRSKCKYANGTNEADRKRGRKEESEGADEVKMHQARTDCKIKKKRKRKIEKWRKKSTFLRRKVANERIRGESVFCFVRRMCSHSQDSKTWSNESDPNCQFSFHFISLHAFRFVILVHINFERFGLFGQIFFIQIIGQTMRGTASRWGK